ncbi:MAG: hypothetical protein LN413_03670 [Candidatus Thermoplasmatota archaeon]|nr:hypothetical protein [Candidatus Thermoplasmatota archaeon]
MTVLTDILTAVVVVLLATSLVVFLVRLTLTVGRGRRTPVEFGVGFAAFIALWMGSELLSVFIPGAFAEAEAIIHFSVMAGFAVWMNLRWRWALRAAQEAS